ncbi:MAG: MazG family protein, partial [Acidimicrobiales bacterium]
KLAVSADNNLPPVTVLARLGLPDESVFEVAWADMDRSVIPDHLTSLFVPKLADPVAGEVSRLFELVRTLRRECPWDREQTHHSLTRHLVEETYEVLEAIEGLDGGVESYAHLEEELGDLLFQVCFHSVLAAEEGQFAMAEVARGVHDKLVRRHPHVFGDVGVDGPEAVMANWEQIKKVEKGRDSLLDGIPGALPSLLYAHKIQRKAATVGIDPEPPDQSHLALGRADAAETGELLFAVVALARRAGVDPEAALRRYTTEFGGRFRRAEVLAARRGQDLASLDPGSTIDLWEEAANPVDTAG